MSEPTPREQVRMIWQAAVDAVRPQELIRAAFANPTLPLREQLARAARIFVVGAGKAGAAMAEAVETCLADSLDRIEGLVNVPGEFPRSPLPCTQARGVAGEGFLAEFRPLTPLPSPLRTGERGENSLQRIRLHVARPPASNQPTAEGVAGARQILDLLSHAGADDVALCLLSGGGSALLPAPVDGVSLDDKQQVTLLLHRSGATINEMNAVRKHLSAIKGGRLAQAFTGRALFSLIISDVIGDPLDVIASGPTASDPTTFSEVLQVLSKYALRDQVPATVRDYLERGMRGEELETPKELPPNVHNLIIGNNHKALLEAQRPAANLGWRVLNLGSFIEGATYEAAGFFAGLIRSITQNGLPLPPPVCILSGGETTVTLPKDHGLGGRNQEFVLALAHKLGMKYMPGVTILSGGTDGEDGPTDAAGAIADVDTLRRASQLGLDPKDFLARHDAYRFFEQTGDLLKTGLTQTNVMDVRVMVVVSEDRI